MNTRFLETFVWLARLKSFSRTAEKLNASQPAISGRIVALEEVLGVTLYDRNVRGFELTAAGRRILERCANIVDLTQELGGLASENNSLGRALRIGASDVVCLSWMSDFVAELASAYPEHMFEIVTDSAPNLSNALRNDEIDLAFVANGVDELRVVNAPLCNYRIAWMANPKKFAVEEVLTIEQLCALPIIMPPPSTPGYFWQTEYLKRHNPGFSMNSPTALRISSGYSPATGIQMVSKGLGVMPLPVLLAQPWLASGELAILNVKEAFPAWFMFASYKAPATIPMITSLVETAQAVAKTFYEAHGGDDFWP